MFEKEAYEWTEKNISVGISMYNPSIEMYCGKAFKDGAEFGYNKAKEEMQVQIEKMKSALIDIKSNTDDVNIEWQIKYLFDELEIKEND